MKKLRISFSQFYLEPGASYHFSGRFLSELQRRISRKVLPSEKLLKKYPSAGKLVFDLDASAKLKRGKICGADVSSSEVELRLVLPYSSLDRNRKRRHASAVKHLVDTIEGFFKSFNMETPESWCKSEISQEFLEQFETNVYDYHD